MTKELKTFSIIEYCTGDFGDLGKHIGEINAFSREEAKAKYQLENNIKDSEIGFYGFSEIIPAKDFVKEAKIILAKQEKIMEAYGSQYNPHINEDGWFDMTYIETVPHLEEKLIDHVSYDVKENFLRPKSLQGIETNNDWIKIESEDDLPKEKCDLLVYPEFENQFVFHFYNDKKCKEVLMQNHTHYQPIEKPKPPIY